MSIRTLFVSHEMLLSCLLPLVLLCTACPDEDPQPGPDSGSMGDMNTTRDMTTTAPDAGTRDADVFADATMTEDMGDTAQDAGVDMSRDQDQAPDSGDMPEDMRDGSDQGDMDALPDQAFDMTLEDAGREDMSVFDAGVPDDLGVDMAADASMPDLGIDMDTDMGPAMCGLATPRCFANSDCADPSTRCEADAAGIACCMPGMRGTSPPGTPCVSENDCDSSLCVGDGAGGLTYCSTTCSSDNECPSQLPRCNPVFGICIPPN